MPKFTKKFILKTIIKIYSTLNIVLWQTFFKYNQNSSWTATFLFFAFSRGNAQKDDEKPRLSLSLFAKAENEDMQLPIKWLACPNIASSTCGSGSSSFKTLTCKYLNLKIIYILSNEIILTEWDLYFFYF